MLGLTQNSNGGLPNIMSSVSFSFNKLAQMYLLICILNYSIKNNEISVYKETKQRIQRYKQ